jgi:hypothetical protein
MYGVSTILLKFQNDFLFPWGKLDTHLYRDEQKAWQALQEPVWARAERQSRRAVLGTCGRDWRGDLRGTHLIEHPSRSSAGLNLSLLHRFKMRSVMRGEVDGVVSGRLQTPTLYIDEASINHPEVHFPNGCSSICTSCTSAVSNFEYQCLTWQGRLYISKLKMELTSFRIRGLFPEKRFIMPWVRKISPQYNFSIVFGPPQGLGASPQSTPKLHR